MPRCQHCVRQEDIETLFRSKLEDIAYGDLEKYFWSAMTTWGDVEDFKCFLPRIFEIMVSEEYIFEIDSIGSKLEYGKFTSWPSEEFEAVTDFFEVVWSIRLSYLESDFDAFASFCETEDYLQCFSVAYQDVQRFLDIWYHNKSVYAVRHLVNFIIMHIGPLTKKDRLWDYQWNLKSQQQIVQFLLDDKTLNKVESAFFQYSDTPFVDEFSEGVKKLEWIRSVYVED